MSNIAKSLIKALSIAVLALVLVNFIFFLIAFTGADLSSSWSIAFKHASFSINDAITGFKFGSFPANTLMSIIGGLVIGMEYRKGNLKAE